MFQETVYDLIGIGFGPSNMALAIAQEEAATPDAPAPSALFLEKQEQFVWHGGMLLPDSDMQISFLKDLVSLRNPTSPYSFINYLHAKGRLSAFINRQTFTPSRIEYNDYLCWVASQFKDRCAYGEEAVSIEPEQKGAVVESLLVRSRDRNGRERVRRTRNLSLALGALPKIPPAFAALKGDKRLIHTVNFLGQLGELDLHGRGDVSIAVVGGGQSGAEIFMDLQSRFPKARIDMILSANALRPADDSPFVNEIFNPEYTDILYRQDADAQREFLRVFHNTNYSVVDRDLIESLYEILYQQQVRGEDQLKIRRSHRITQVAASAAGIEIATADMMAGTTDASRYDVVVLCTGYERNRGAELLKGIAEYVPDFKVDRHYRLKSTPDFRPAVFLQGCSEATHGLSDSLLSVISVRAQEIAVALQEAAESSRGVFMAGRSRDGMAEAVRA